MVVLKAPSFWRGLGGGCEALLPTLHLLLHLVLRQLFALRSLQELLHAVAGSICTALGGEHDVHALDVVGYGEGLRRAGTLRADSANWRVLIQLVGTMRAYHLPLRFVPTLWS